MFNPQNNRVTRRKVMAATEFDAVVGVFIMRDGKVHEWADYVAPKS